MAQAVADQQLLYALRSPTTPLEDKVQRAQAALDAAPTSTSLPPLVRDWALDYLNRATRSDSGEAALRSSKLWSLLARATEATPSTAAITPPLAVFVAFVGLYSSNEPDLDLLRSAATAWRRLATVAMRKATVDQALDGYEKLIAASLHIYSQQRAAVDAVVASAEQELWQDLAITWLKPLRTLVLDAGKGGKKIPAHTLALLPQLLPLLARLPSTALFRASLLETIQLAIFNVENLKRGLARDSYTAGSAEPSAVATADAELLAALASLPPTAIASSYSALPSLTNIYASALAANAPVLFPLPAKANFPTPSAQKSALEVLGLTKRRELAGKWTKRVADYLSWSQPADKLEFDDADLAGERDKAAALAGVLEEVEKADLYRVGQAEESWENVLANLAEGAVGRLERFSRDAVTRDALVGVLAIVGRLDHAALEPTVPRVLAVLARTPSTSLDLACSTCAFLTDLVTFHSRSVSLPALLSLLANALTQASDTAEPANNLLTAPAFCEQLGRALGGMTGGASAVRAAWENLIEPVRETLSPTAAPSIVNEEASPSPSKKRKISSPATTSLESYAAASHVRVATHLIRNAPAASLSSLVETLRNFVDTIVDMRLKDFAKASCLSSVAAGHDGDVGTPSKKDKKRRRKSGMDVEGDGASGMGPEVRLGIELLELWYAVVERLNREGLLQGDNWWEVRAKRRDNLREVVETGSGESAVEAVRTLLQHFELTDVTDASRAEAQSVLAAILARLAMPETESTWDGFVRGIASRHVPVALWELVARRWLPVINACASEDQLQQVAAFVVAALSTASESSPAISFASSTYASLQRADFWELTRLQGPFQSALLQLVTVPSLAPLPDIFSQADASQAIGPADLAQMLAAARLFPAILATVPLEYLSKDLRVQLSNRALALDLVLSASSTLGDPEKAATQNELRRFVAAMSAPMVNAATVAARLLDSALPDARSATLSLYRTTVVDPALSSLKTSQSVDELSAAAQFFGDKPLQDLAKRVKSGDSQQFRLTTREQALLVLLEALVLATPDVTTLSAPFAELLRASVKNASKSLDKTLPPAIAALQRTSRAILDTADLLQACHILWRTCDWLETYSSEDATVYTDFSQAALITALQHLSAVATDPQALHTASAVLDLLSYRVERQRKNPPAGKGNVETFETIIAAHIAVRAVPIMGVEPVLDAALARTAASANVEEYGAALDSLTGLLAVTGAAIAPSEAVTVARFAHALAVAQVLILAGPEGSSRVAASALSEILRQLALIVEHVDGSHPRTVQIYLVVARFLDSVCSERPLLLSRFNISSVLAIVSHVLRPSTAHTATVPSGLDAQPASQLYQTLVATVGHIVRHRKDHVVPLFPLLVSTLSSLLSVLRRAGLGTLGASLDDIENPATLGQRAEREAKTTFPAWVWAGGAQSVGKAEAKAMGRLLGSLTAKTTTTTASKRKHGAADETSTNTSLTAPLSKHAPFLLLNYLRACVHPTCPIPSALRAELQGGWFEVMDAMGKWEREALMKGMLSEDEEAERGVLRSMWKSWEKERYRG